MRIIRASLCLRFRPMDGWTREAVRELLKKDQRLERVCPRYFDERDKLHPGWEVNDGLPHDECDYFAVYGVDEPFDAGKLSEHEII